MLFDEPVMLQANVWYVAWARISGPSSDCGSSGQSVLTTDDQFVLSISVSLINNVVFNMRAMLARYMLSSCVCPSVCRKSEL